MVRTTSTAQQNPRNSGADDTNYGEELLFMVLGDEAERSTQQRIFNINCVSDNTPENSIKSVMFMTIIRRGRRWWYTPLHNST